MRFVCSRGPATPDDAGIRTAVSSSDLSSLGPADEEGFVKAGGFSDDPREAPSATSHAFHDELRAGFPDERRPVWPRPFAADYVETVTTDLSSKGWAKEEGFFEGSEFEPRISRMARINETMAWPRES